MSPATGKLGWEFGQGAVDCNSSILQLAGGSSEFPVEFSILGFLKV